MLEKGIFLFFQTEELQSITYDFLSDISQMNSWIEGLKPPTGFCSDPAPLILSILQSDLMHFVILDYKCTRNIETTAAGVQIGLNFFSWAA